MNVRSHDFHRRAEGLEAAVRHGLRRSPKRLHPKWVWQDERGYFSVHLLPTRSAEGRQ